ncbi:MAG: zinc ribbon domain-containing protein [Acidobacteria bacterium]|nr:zinc ribbon domain-containing protein [Acidobacteriota bacterium]
MARRTTKTAGQTGGSRRVGAAAPSPSAVSARPEAGGVRPWHLLVLGVLMAAAAGAVMTSDGGTVQTVAVIATILTAGLVAAGVVRTLAPLVADEAGEETEMLGGRTRAALEREKMLVLRSIKEVEFDRAMRKISDADYNEIVPRLRTRAVGLIRQLEGGGGYRALIERDLAALVSANAPSASASAAPDAVEPGDQAAAAPVAAGTCPDCSTINGRDARFCKSCGTRLAGGV